MGVEEEDEVPTSKVTSVLSFRMGKCKKEIISYDFKAIRSRGILTVNC